MILSSHNKQIIEQVDMHKAISPLGLPQGGSVASANTAYLTGIVGRVLLPVGKCFNKHSCCSLQDEVQ